MILRTKEDWEFFDKITGKSLFKIKIPTWEKEIKQMPLFKVVVMNKVQKVNADSTLQTIERVVYSGEVVAPNEKLAAFIAGGSIKELNAEELSTANISVVNVGGGPSKDSGF